VITKGLLNAQCETGIYYDDKGNLMLSSELVRDPKFTATVQGEQHAK
jgi:hypothetical protein